MICEGFRRFSYVCFTMSKGLDSCPVLFYVLVCKMKKRGQNTTYFRKRVLVDLKFYLYIE